MPIGDLLLTAELANVPLSEQQQSLFFKTPLANRYAATFEVRPTFHVASRAPYLLSEYRYPPTSLLPSHRRPRLFGRLATRATATASSARRARSSAYCPLPTSYIAPRSDPTPFLSPPIQVARLRQRGRARQAADGQGH